MGEIFKTSAMSRAELERLWECRGEDLKRLAQENARLQADCKMFRAEIERLERLIVKLKSRNQ